MLSIYFTRKPKNISAEKLFAATQNFPNYLKDSILTNNNQSSALGYLLLNQALKDAGQYDLLSEISRSETGKPFFKNSHWHFNISHSGDYVVCAVSDKNELGIDIQIHKALNISYYQRHFTENEWHNLITATDSSKAFCRLWSQKEALMKADGRGLDIPLKTIIIESEKATKIDKNSWFLTAIPIDKNYETYLATQYKPTQLKLIEIKFLF
jgi:4'-phosphopantetheinyl transferase